MPASTLQRGSEVSLKIPTLSLPAARHRRRINANPRLSLAVYRIMKAEDLYGFGVTVQELATRLLAISISGTTADYLKGN